MTVIVDYGMGNLRSVQKACARMGLTAEVTSDPRTVASASAVILPGVGAFGQAMDNLRSLRLIEPLQQAAASGRPFLGICLGMHLLLDSSDESFGRGLIPGLGVFPGTVRRFPPGLKVPQMGWNQMEVKKADPLLESVPKSSYVYFVHSYYADPLESSDILTTTEYGITFTSSLVRDSVYGIQFHPEKSSGVGMTILQNFGVIVHDYISSH